MASLKVSYSVINEAIMQLHNISSKPEEIYGLILGICNNAADMLQVAKYLYSDMDDSMSEQMN